MRVSWPDFCSWTARWRTWSLTPPAVAKSYGETRPTFIPCAFSSWRSRPDAMRHVPLLGMAPDELLDPAQQLPGCAHLVRPRVPGRLREHQRRAFGHVGIVRQPVDADGKKRRASAQGNRRRTERDGRQLAEERHQIAGARDVAVDRRDLHLLLAQRLQHL